MSKPLELAVYPAIPPMPIGRFEVEERLLWWADRDREIDASASKRFTDVELAAEYGRLRLKVCATGNRDMKAKGHVCIEWQAAHDELDTMQRFMDLPHYDEPQS